MSAKQHEKIMRLRGALIDILEADERGQGIPFREAMYRAKRLVAECPKCGQPGCNQGCP